MPITMNQMPFLSAVKEPEPPPSLPSISAGAAEIFASKSPSEEETASFLNAYSHDNQSPGTAETTQGHESTAPQDDAGETTQAPEPGELDKGKIHQLEAHGQQMVSNQKSLNKWNLNGEGRNQGVVHLIDYSKARPSKLAVAGQTLRPSLSDKKIDMLLEADKKGYRAPTHNELTDSTANGRFQLSDADVKTLQDKKFLTPVETPAYKGAKRQLDDARKNLQDLDKAKTKELQGAGIKGKKLGEQLKEYKATDPAYKAAQEAVGSAEAHLKASTHYVMTSDESKGGRLELIAKAGDREKIANGKEIEDGTAIVEGLAGEEGVDKQSQVKPPDMERPLSGYRKIGKRRWKEESIPADERKHTASTSVTGNGLNVKGWGVMENPEGEPFDDPNVKFSTVMGASKK